ncbi:L,D-transpeptidase [Thermomonas sp. LB-4]|uniref:L,D-transpeptidase family protein n=1 Tax=Thermomonas sp. LB-4 TaxID=3102790 RepID=UPI002ED7ABFB
MSPFRHATPLLLAALAACSAQSPAMDAANEAMGRTPPAAPQPAPAAAPGPAPTAAAAAAVPPPASAPPAAPVLGPQPVRAWGTGPSPEAAAADAPAPVAASGQAANDATTTTGRDGVLRAQVLLLRAHYSSGEIDGVAGKNLARAVRGFQTAKGLKASGTLDAATWAALNQDAAPVLVEYTLTAGDVAGPYAPTPETPEDKAKLKRLGYQDIGEMLGERFNSKPALIKALNPDARMEAGSVLVVPYTQPARQLPKAATLVVDKSDGVLQLLDSEDKVYAQFPASTGSTRFPLPIGQWKITTVVHDPDYRYDPDLLVDQPKDAKPAMLPPGPNGPVGLVWMGIDKPHYGIHGTPEPGDIRRDQSSGCVRLTNFAAQAVADAVAVGTPVRFQE